MMLIKSATMEIVTSSSIIVKPVWIRCEDRKDRTLGRSSQFFRFRSFSHVRKSMSNSNQNQRNFSLPPVAVLWHRFSIMKGKCLIFLLFVNYILCPIVEKIRKKVCIGPNPWHSIFERRRWISSTAVFWWKNAENDGRIEKVIFDLIQRPLCRLTLAS